MTSSIVESSHLNDSVLRTMTEGEPPAPRQSEGASFRREPEQGCGQMPELIVRRIRIARRKREDAVDRPRPRAEETRICLLELYPPGQGDVQRRAIQVQIGGEVVWREFEIVTSFASVEEATRYARDHDIDDVEI